MKKLHVIAPNEPNIFGKGYQVLLYYRLLELRQEFSICLYTFSTFEFKLFTRKKEVKTEYYSHTVISLGILEILKNIIISFLFNRPLLTAFNTSRSLTNKFQKEKNAIFICYLSRCFLNVRSSNDNMVIVELVDSMALNFRRRVISSSLLKKMIFLREQLLSEKFESMIASRVGLTTTVSDIDAKLVAKNVQVHPLGVDTRELSEKASADVICFSGNMNYEPNVNAVLWFYNSVWKHRPDEFMHWKFRVIGAKPTNEILNIAKLDASVEVTGFVKSISDEIKKCKISVAPMRAGSGMQFKILEAMALGVPVVATRMALGDIRAQDKIHLLLAEGEFDYWDAIKSLHSSPEYYHNVSKNAHNFVLEHHSWSNLNKGFLQGIHSVLEGGA